MERRTLEPQSEGMEILRRAREVMRRSERPEVFQTASEVERYMQFSRTNFGSFLPFTDYSVRTAQPGHDQLGEQGVITRGRVIPNTATTSASQPSTSSIAKPIRRSIRRTQLSITSPEHQQTTAKRLLAEASEIRSSAPRNILASPKGDDLYEWFGSIDGPVDTPYRGGIFFFSIELPQDYPFRPPKVTFHTRIYHPNIDHTGLVCIEELAEGKWRPTLRILNVLEMLISMFYGAVAENALMPIISRQYQEDRPEFERTAQLWSQKYAS